jgi:triacylglycerol esterase/lipase EstA (alpha/beta hydrolase family)
MNDSAGVHRVYLIPGLFGFGQLAGYDYFEHLERALAARFAAAGVALALEVISAPPTASILLRASILEQRLADSAGERGPIHLLGHSTGGLDARLIVAPGARLKAARREAPPAPWRARVRSVVSINTPHYGTPLAGYFATAAGTRMLYLLSVLTVASLSVGRIPLGAFSSALRAVSGLDRKFGFQVKLLNDLTSQLLSIVGTEGRAQILAYLSLVKHDQAGIIQLMPEVMELFNATVSDHPDVRYGCIATVAPLPGPRRIMAAIGRPLSALHLAIYSTVYGFASRAAARYPYAVATAEQSAMLGAALVSEVRDSTVDGIVPTLSMLWGELLWCGYADHLDIMGHFGDVERPPVHVDWLQSGASFTRRDFDAMADALSSFLLRDA